MTQFFGKIAKTASSAVSDMLFGKDEQPVEEDIAADSKTQPKTEQKYKFFQTKNNAGNSNNSTRVAPLPQTVTPIRTVPSRATSVRPQAVRLSTPRLSNPEHDSQYLCRKCEVVCPTVRCHNCKGIAYKAPISSGTMTFKPIVPRSMNTSSTQVRPDSFRSSKNSPVRSSVSAHVENVVDLDDEEPIPICNGVKKMVIPPPSLIHIPNSRVSLSVKQLFLGTMVADSEVILHDRGIDMRNMSMKLQLSKENFLIRIPFVDCNDVKYYMGPETSPVDLTLLLFINAGLTTCRDLMKRIEVKESLRPIYKMDPNDKDEKYHYICIKCKAEPEAEEILQSIPSVSAWGKVESFKLFERIQSASGACFRKDQENQLQNIRSSEKERFRLNQTFGRPSSSSNILSSVLTNGRSRASAGIVQKTSPEVIELEEEDTFGEDELALLTSNPSTPPPKRQCVKKESLPGDDEVMAVYPQDSPHPVTIFRADLRCLNEGEYLNDNILDFYLNYILHSPNMIPDDVRKKTWLFNTFFFSKLNSKPKPGEVAVGRDQHHEKVKNWLKHDDICSKDFLIVPVNRAKHWFLLIVCYHNQVPSNPPVVDVEQNVGDLSSKEKKPCILLMDSLNVVRHGTRSRLTFPLRCVLASVWKEKGEIKNFDHNAMPDRRIIVTEQHNYYDCGLYLLQYVEQFLKDPSSILSDGNSNRSDWVDRKIMGDKRNKIHDLIMRLNGKQNEVSE